MPNLTERPGYDPGTKTASIVILTAMEMELSFLRAAKCRGRDSGAFRGRSACNPPVKPVLGEENGLHAFDSRKRSL